VDAVVNYLQGGQIQYLERKRLMRRPTFPRAVFFALSTAASPAVKAVSTALMVALPIALEIWPTAESANPVVTSERLKEHEATQSCH
jgi:hypothetical protein